MIPAANYSTKSNIIEILAYMCSPANSTLFQEDPCVIQTSCALKLKCFDEYGNKIEDRDRLFLKDDFEVHRINEKRI